MKLRLLNGAHSLIAYLGCLSGLHLVRDVMANPTALALVKRHMHHATKTLEPIDNFDFFEYANSLIVRFENPAIEHSCIQIAMDGSQKLSQRIFTLAAESLALGEPLDSYAFAIAAWMQFACGHDDEGGPLAISDPLAGPIRRAMEANGNNAERQIKAFANLEGLAHQNMLNEPRFTGLIQVQLEAIRALGTLKAAHSLMVAAH